MRIKSNIKKRSALFGLINWNKKSLSVDSTDDGEKVRFSVSQEAEAFKIQYESLEYPDPESSPPIFEPARDGN